MNVMGLVQLCEAAQPVGGYSYSFGIERMAKSGELRTGEQLTSLVKGILHASIGPADGVASGIIFRAARKGDLEQVPVVIAAMNSDRLPAEMRMASLQMGERLWTMSRGWEWAGSMHEQLDGFAMKSPLHYAVAFGALVSETTSSQVRAIATYLFNTAKNIVSVAVQTIPLDETDGVRVLSDVQPTIAELAAACADKGPGDIAAVGPLGH